MLRDWTTPLVYGSSLVLALELLHLVLRRTLPRFRIGLAYHLWVVVLGLLLTLHQAAFDHAHLLWQMTLGAAVVLTTLVVLLLGKALVVERPWAPAEPPMLPKLAQDVLVLAFLAASALLVAKEVFDQPLGAVLVSSTVLSAVVGLALQDVLKNVFAGMSLDIEKPFSRGDWLMLDSRTWAQVVEISWRSVRLRTPEGVEISEPNANVASLRLENYGSGRHAKAFGFTVGLPYEAPPAEVKAALRAAASSVADAIKSPPARVFLESFDDHAITYHLRVWTRSMGDQRGFRDRVNSRIWYELKRRGLYVPFPIRTLHMNRAEDMSEEGKSEKLRLATQLLSEVELFRELEPNVVHDLAVAARHHYFDEGEVLVREGDEGDSLFVLAKGSAFVTRRAEDGEEDLVVATLEVGDFFGERSLLTGESRSATVVSEGSLVLGLTKEAVAPILKHDPTIAETLSRALAARQAEADAAMENHLDKKRRSTDETDQVSLLGKIRSFFKI